MLNWLFGLREIKQQPIDMVLGEIESAETIVLVQKDGFDSRYRIGRFVLRELTNGMEIEHPVIIFFFNEKEAAIRTALMNAVDKITVEKN